MIRQKLLIENRMPTSPRGALAKCAFPLTERRMSCEKKIKVPSFSPEDPELWFALLEGQFESQGITDDNIKFTNVTNNLDPQYAKSVKDIIINPPSMNRYEKIKTE